MVGNEDRQFQKKMEGKSWGADRLRSAPTALRQKPKGQKEVLEMLSTKCPAKKLLREFPALGAYD